MGTPQKRRLDEREYLEREALAAERHEFVDGVVHAMAGAGERHNRIALNLAVALRVAARGTGCGVYISDMKLRVGHGRSCYYPDVLLSCERTAPDAVFVEAPCFVAEVLSPSTSAVDTREKLQAYRAIQSLRYYLMVDSGRVAAAYSVRGADGQWLEANLDPGEQLDIECGAMRASLNLTDLYEETGLTVA